MIDRHRPFRVPLLVALLLALALPTGCARKDSPTAPGADDLPAEILNLMRDRTSGDRDWGCMGCHNPSTSPRWDLTTYSAVYAGRATVRAKINGGSMTDYLMPGEHQVIIDWIDAGAPR